VAKLMAARPEVRYRSPAEVAAALSSKTSPAASSPAGVVAEQDLTPIVVEPSDADTSKPPGKNLQARAAEMLQRVGPVGSVLKKHWKLAAAAAAGALFLGMVCFVLLLVWLFSGGKPETQVAQGTSSTPSTAPAAPALPTITNSLDMKLVQIPAGEFQMGSPETETGRSAHEGPRSKVTIGKPFFLSTNVVTVGHFKKFMDSQGYTTWAERTKKAHRWNPTRQTTEEDSSLNWKNPGWAIEDDQPVVCLAWDDTEEFCKWLNWKEGKKYRLPTEAEWEYACRANTTTPFWNGTSLSSTQANFNGEFPYGGAAKGTNVGKVSKVGSYPPNAFGLYDMHGNVWQWCRDYYLDEYYQIGKKEDPHGPFSGTDRIMRGGSWADQAAACRSASRGKGREHFYCDNRTGFRVVQMGDGK
jgi:formylglycine-generating enzyme required for sulfatase activity